MTLASQDGPEAEAKIDKFIDEHPELIRPPTAEKFTQKLTRAANYWRDKERRSLDTACRVAYVTLRQWQLKLMEKEDEEILAKLGV